MSKLILVLEENPEIQSVIASSLKDTNISINQESNTELFLKKAKDLVPDLIFLSIRDSQNGLKICKDIRNEISLEKIPIILLLNAQDSIDDYILSELGIKDTLRKPFEALILREKINQFIKLDENFGNGPAEDEEEFKLDMSEIDDELKEIKHARAFSKELPDIKKSISEIKKENDLESPEIINLDSVLLENSKITKSDQANFESKNNLSKNKDEYFFEKEASVEKKLDLEFEETLDGEIDLENGFEYELELDEDDNEQILPEIKKVTDGLEELKNSGLENQFAENRLSNRKEENGEKLRTGMNKIDLEVNDFKENIETWERPEDLDLYHQTPREGLKDINLVDSDFKPEFPKNLSSFGDSSDLSLPKLDETNKDISSILDEMDKIEIEGDLQQNFNGVINLDNILLTDQKVKDEKNFEVSVNLKKSELESTIGLEGSMDSKSDQEIKSMVQDSFKVEKEIDESGLNELEELSTQMEELDEEGLKEEGLGLSDEEISSEEEEIEEGLNLSGEEISSEEEDIEEGLGLSGEEIFSEEEEIEEGLGLSDEEISSEEEEIKDEGLELLSEEIFSEGEEIFSEEGDIEEEELLLEEQEKEIDLEEQEIDSIGLGIEKENDEKDEQAKKWDLDEDVFDNWDDAENAFMNFDRKSDVKEEIYEDLNEAQEKSQESEAYSFTEEELKEIVSSSVKNALEKSIASSLVELAISELKNKVNQMDQDWA